MVAGKKKKKKKAARLNSGKKRKGGEPLSVPPPIVGERRERKKKTRFRLEGEKRDPISSVVSRMERGGGERGRKKKRKGPAIGKTEVKREKGQGKGCSHLFRISVEGRERFFVLGGKRGCRFAGAPCGGPKKRKKKRKKKVVEARQEKGKVKKGQSPSTPSKQLYCQKKKKRKKREGERR